MESAAGRGEDDLTVKLAEIVAVNNIIRAAMAGGKASNLKCNLSVT